MPEWQSWYVMGDFTIRESEGDDVREFRSLTSGAWRTIIDRDDLVVAAWYGTSFSPYHIIFIVFTKKED